MLPDKYGIHEKTVKKADGSYDVVIGRFLCFAYTIISLIQKTYRFDGRSLSLETMSASQENP